MQKFKIVTYSLIVSILIGIFILNLKRISEYPVRGKNVIFFIDTTKSLKPFENYINFSICRTVRQIKREAYSMNPRFVNFELWSVESSTGIVKSNFTCSDNKIEKLSGFNMEDNIINRFLITMNELNNERYSNKDNLLIFFTNFSAGKSGAASEITEKINSLELGKSSTTISFLLVWIPVNIKTFQYKEFTKGVIEAMKITDISSCTIRSNALILQEGEKGYDIKMASITDENLKLNITTDFQVQHNDMVVRKTTDYLKKEILREIKKTVRIHTFDIFKLTGIIIAIIFAFILKSYV